MRDFVCLLMFGEKSIHTYTQTKSSLSPHPLITIPTRARGIGSSATLNLAVLANARLVTCKAFEQHHRLYPAAVKWLTGNDTISTRSLYKEPFQFKANSTILCINNYYLLWENPDPAVWNRLHCFQFDKVEFVDTTEAIYGHNQKLKDGFLGVFCIIIINGSTSSRTFLPLNFVKHEYAVLIFLASFSLFKLLRFRRKTIMSRG